MQCMARRFVLELCGVPASTELLKKRAIARGKHQCRLHGRLRYQTESHLSGRVDRQRRSRVQLITTCTTSSCEPAPQAKGWSTRRRDWNTRVERNQGPASIGKGTALASLPSWLAAAVQPWVDGNFSPTGSLSSAGLSSEEESATGCRLWWRQPCSHCFTPTSVPPCATHHQLKRCFRDRRMRI